MKKIKWIIVASAIGVFLFYSSSLWAANESSLAQENTQLKARVAELEAKVESLERRHPSTHQSTQPKTVDAVSGSWFDQMHEGINRVDQNFYVKETKAYLIGSYQYDSRVFNSLEIAGATQLPLGFSTFDYYRFDSSEAPAASRTDATQLFIEMDLMRELWNGLGVITEYNDTEGDNDAVGRFGFFYSPQLDALKKLDLTLYTKWFVVATDPDQNLQGTVAWNWTPPYLLEGRFSISGFYEWNFVDFHPKSHQDVTDVQFTYRLLGDLSTFVKYRFNEFLGDKEGWAWGMQYQF